LPEIPNFTSPRWQESRSDAELVVSITEGKGRHMPPFGRKFNRAQMRQLVHYIRDLAPRAARRVVRPRPVRKMTEGEDDFEKRFHELEQEFDRLREELRKLSEQRKK
jgi:hypothetical protein